MKLLLCSWVPYKNKKLEQTFLDLINKPPEENKLIILSTDTTSPFHVNQHKLLTDWYKEKGLKEENIRIINLIHDETPSLQDLDVLHVWGGNEFEYLKHIREKGLEQEVRDFINRNCVYIGLSAGSIIMSKTLDENLSEDKNEVGLKDLNGFGFIDFNLLVHWDTFMEGLHAKQLMYSWETGRKVVCLTDEQAVLVTEEGFKIISP